MGNLQRSADRTPSNARGLFLMASIHEGARGRNERLTLDEPTQLPEGAEVEPVPTVFAEELGVLRTASQGDPDDDDALPGGQNRDVRPGGEATAS